MREAMRGLLPEEVLRQRGWLNPQAVRRMTLEHRRGTHDWALQIWQFLTLELWAQRFLDKTPAPAAS